MGLLVSATAKKNILIQGTQIELKSVYVRLEYVAKENGKMLEITSYTYYSKNAYKSLEKVLLTDLPMQNITIELLENQPQDLSSAELYSKISYEAIGYEVKIL